MAGLVPAIRVFLACQSTKTWMPGTSPGMTTLVEPALRLLRPIPEWRRLHARDQMIYDRPDVAPVREHADGAIMRRRDFTTALLTAAAALGAWPRVRAQAAMPVVGILRMTSAKDSAHLIAAFRQGLG